TYPDDPTYRCFRWLDVTLARSTEKPIGFENKLNTGWLNCDGTPQTPCDQAPAASCSTIGLCLEAAMDDTEVKLAMNHNWDVYWPQAGRLQLVPRSRPGGGTLAVSYRLSPTFGIFLDIPNVYTGAFALDPLTILDALDQSGKVKRFEASASGSCTFDPFAFDPPVSCPLKPSGTGEIFALPLSDVGLDFGKLVTIELGLVAGTSDVLFSWQTDELSVDGGDVPITKDNPATSVPYNGGAQAAALVRGKGTLHYEGKTYLKPAVKITEIVGIPVNVLWPIDVGADLPFAGDVPVELAPQGFTVGLPDLFVPSSSIDFGVVEVGQLGSRQVTLSSTGKMTARAELSSTKKEIFEPRQKEKFLSPATEATVDIDFTPVAEGPIEATIVVASNDPDLPEQSFKVLGYGVARGGPVGGQAGQAGAGQAGAGQAGQA
ncbi:MAG: hypothetical protein EOO75_17195, partial [Myxococcales bacterium]